jgi:transposase
MAKDIVRNDSVTFIAFLKEIDASIEDRLSIHVVMDNGSSHTSKATKAWLSEHPRFVVHHTPAHASWLNQVLECFFSILTRKLLGRGELSSREDLVAKLLAFVEHDSEGAKPFNWVYDAKLAA